MLLRVCKYMSLKERNVIKGYIVGSEGRNGYLETEGKDQRGYIGVVICSKTLCPGAMQNLEISMSYSQNKMVMR